jgi:hypothetical protein
MRAPGLRISTKVRSLFKIYFTELTRHIGSVELSAFEMSVVQVSAVKPCHT